MNILTYTDYGHAERAFFQNPKLFGLGRQIGLKFIEAFVVFSAELSALFWRCESLVHGMYLVVFPAKNCSFQAEHI